MSQPKTPRGTSLIVAALLFLPAVMPAATAAETRAASQADVQAHFRLQWQLVENIALPRGQSRSRAAFLLTNNGKQPLPASGWALYFNCMDGVQTEALQGGFVLERVGGSLFRLVPGPGFKGLAAGQTARIEYWHSYLATSARIPAGPYIAFDAEPGAAYAIADYRIAPLDRPERAGATAALPAAAPTPEAIYARNDTARLPDDGDLPPVFPTPRDLREGKGTLTLGAMPKISARLVLHAESEVLAALLKPYLPEAAAGGRAATISLHIGSVRGQASPEAYELVIDPARGITITGNSRAGVFYGLQTLRDLLPLKPEKQVKLKAMRIVDAPRFAYRGFHLDVARNFHSKETVLKVLDLMARYKLNTFHFHLADDEGWRIETPSIPELNEIGSRRGHTLTTDDFLQPAYGSGPDVDDPHGSGYYRRSDYIEILKYAAAHHINVIPEIEMPGHARAAVKAMESRYRRLTKIGDPSARQYLLSDPEDRSQYSSPQLYNDHVMNPGMPSTYAFIGRVLDDLIEVHEAAGVPLKTIHVGGDELPAGAWEKSPASLALMQSLGMKSTADLWNHFYDRVDGMLRERGLFSSGWEEMGLRRAGFNRAAQQEPNPFFFKRGFRLYVWNNLGDNGADLAYRLANAGYDTVLAPATRLYFDMAHNADPSEPGVDWAAYIDLDDVYDFIPLDYLRNPFDASPNRNTHVGLTDSGRRHILGLQGCLWTETVRDEDRLDYLMMPRLLALAERAWAPDPVWARETDPAKAKSLHRDAWSGFVNVLGKRVLPRLDADGMNVRYRIAPPGLKIEDGKVLVNHQLPGMVLRHTVDGAEPDENSPEIRGPIAAKGVIRVAAFDSKGRHGAVSVIENR